MKSDQNDTILPGHWIELQDQISLSGKPPKTKSVQFATNYTSFWKQRNNSLRSDLIAFGPDD